MIAQGTIQETTERVKSPFAAVISQYRTAARKQVERRLRKSRGATANEVRAVGYYLSTAEKLETADWIGLEESNA